MFYTWKRSLFSGLFLMILVLMPHDVSMLSANVPVGINHEQQVADRYIRGHKYRTHRYIPYNYYHNGHRYYPNYGYQPYEDYTYGNPYYYEYDSYNAPYDGYGNYYYTPGRSGVSIYLGT